MSEVWKDVVGYEGYYQVSNLGRIKSLNRYVKAKNNSKKLMKSKVLKPVKNDRGYLMVVLSKNAKKRKIFVHRLVAEAFIPNPSNYPQVNHIKEMEKDNNNVINLEWCTCSYNCKYGTRGKRIWEKRRTKNA